MNRAMCCRLFFLIFLFSFLLINCENQAWTKTNETKALKRCPLHLMPLDDSLLIRFPPAGPEVWIEKDQQVEVMEAMDKWLYVRVYNVVGFVKKENFSLIGKSSAHPSLSIKLYLSDFDSVEIEKFVIDTVTVSKKQQEVCGYDKNGVLRVSGYCTTGRLGHETQSGVWQIKKKEPQVYLSGAGYSLPVAFWMPFCGNQGLHDASWRTFLGPWENHDNYGSHGCVNLPYFLAEFLYKHTRAGTTVIVY